MKDKQTFIRRYYWLLAAGLLLLSLAACQSATTEATFPPATAVQEPTAAPQEEPAVVPSVSVDDQALENETVSIAEVISNGPGWLVVHAQADGKPGPILGYSPLKDGVNTDVQVEIDAANATETLYAMLHADAGQVGQWEFPDGPDVPVKVGEQVVTPPFKVLAAPSEAMPDSEAVLMLGGNDELGPFLVDPQGMTLYLFTKDEAGITNCYDKCAENWPPLMLAEGQSLTAGEGLPGELGTTERTDGGMQVTYNGMPLYYWVNDAAPGDTTGHGVGGVWAVVAPEMFPYTISAADSQVSYEVGETFLNDNRFAVAVGVTNGITGKIYLDTNNPLATLISPIEVDISQFTSDSERRDNKIRSDFLESSAYPVATFMPTVIEGLPESYQEGEQLTLQISGDLTVKEVTQPVTFEANVQVQDGQLIGQANSTILMSDFGVGPITILGILETEDEVILTFNFEARQ